MAEKAERREEVANYVLFIGMGNEILTEVTEQDAKERARKAKGKNPNLVIELRKQTDDGTELVDF